MVRWCVGARLESEIGVMWHVPFHGLTPHIVRNPCSGMIGWYIGYWFLFKAMVYSIYLLPILLSYSLSSWARHKLAFPWKTYLVWQTWSCCLMYSLFSHSSLPVPSLFTLLHWMAFTDTFCIHAVVVSALSHSQIIIRKNHVSMGCYGSYIELSSTI